MTSDQRAYPLPRAAPGGGDGRFTMGLVYDVSVVLERHGYPPVRHGLDVVDLQQSLFGFLYGGDARAGTEVS